MSYIMSNILVEAVNQIISTSNIWTCMSDLIDLQFLKRKRKNTSSFFTLWFPVYSCHV